MDVTRARGGAGREPSARACAWLSDQRGVVDGAGGIRGGILQGDSPCSGTGLKWARPLRSAAQREKRSVRARGKVSAATTTPELSQIRSRDDTTRKSRARLRGALEPDPSGSAGGCHWTIFDRCVRKLGLELLRAASENRFPMSQPHNFCYVAHWCLSGFTRWVKLEARNLEDVHGSFP